MALITTIETPLVLDLAINNGYHKAYGMQFDNNTRKLIISLENNGVPYTIPSGVTAKLQGHRPDGAAIFKDCQIINNQLHCVLTSYELAVPGDCILNITLYEGKPNLAQSFNGNRISTFSFKVAVPANPLDEKAIVSTKEFSVLTEMILKAENALKEAEEALDKAEDLIDDLNDLKKRNEELSDKLDEQIDKVNEGLNDIDDALDKINDTINDALDDVDDAIKNANEAADRANQAADNFDSLMNDKFEDVFVEKSEVGEANGVASLDNNGKVPLSQLPDNVGGTGIYVQEDLPTKIGIDEHWFKIIDNLNSSDYDSLLSNLIPKNISLTNLDEAVGIKWTDPTDSSWKGTKLMRRTNTSARSSDWTLLTTTTTKNKYSSTQYVDNNLINGTEYIYGIFPYSANEENKDSVFSIIPSEIKPNILTGIDCAESTNTLTPIFSKDSTVAKVVLVYKEGGIPESISDGTKIDNYVSGTPITGLTNDIMYGLRFFVYNAKGRVNDNIDMSITGTPVLIITLTVPERLSITQGKTIDLTWNIDPETEKDNVIISISDDGLTLNSNKTQISALASASTGEKIITWKIKNIEKKTTVTVIAENSYTITYMLDGGINSTSNPSSIKESQTITLENPTKDNYTFDGWYTDSGFSNRVSTLSSITSNITLYAKFVENAYTITYVLNGGTNNSSNPTTIVYNDTVTLADPTKTACTFDGWYTEASFTNKVTSLSNTTSNITLYAKFTAISYTVTYELNNGTNASSNPTTITYYDTVTLLDATRSNYVFGGWYTDSSFTNKVTTLSNINSNITLYAKFEVAPYTGLAKNISQYNNDTGLYVYATKPSDAFGMRLVRNEDHIPENETDGETSNFSVASGNIMYSYSNKVTPNKSYYYAVYPYDTRLVYNCDKSQSFTYKTTHIAVTTPVISSINVDSTNVTIKVTIPKVTPHPYLTETHKMAARIDSARIAIRKDSAPVFTDYDTVECTGTARILSDFNNGLHYYSDTDTNSLYSSGSAIPVNFAIDWLDYKLNGDYKGTYYVQIFATNWDYTFGDDNGYALSEVKTFTIS